MKVLVTGAAGFVGSHLAEYLLRAGHEVTGLDDLSTGRESNLDAVRGEPGFRLVIGSVLDAALVNELTRPADCVFHLAAAVGTFVILGQTLNGLRTNVHGTENVVDAAGRHGARLLLTSTSEIYGKNDKNGLREDDDRVVGSPLMSRWSYSEAKALDESLVDAYVRERGLRAVIVRLFNTVGPRQAGQYGMVLPRFARQAISGQPVTVYGTEDQIRCFCHVLDVVPALVDLMFADAAQGRAVNLGSDEQTTIRELAGRVILAARSSSAIRLVPYADAYQAGFEDMRRRVPDCGLAREFTGFTPARSLDDIIADVADCERQATLGAS